MDEIFQTYLLTSTVSSLPFIHLRNNYPSDIQLKCEDSEELVEAHKVVLAACSKFFEEKLGDDDQVGNLMLILPPRIHIKSLRKIVELMYNETVVVPRAEFQDFIAAAFELKINSIIKDDIL